MWQHDTPLETVCFALLERKEIAEHRGAVGNRGSIA